MGRAGSRSVAASVAVRDVARRAGVSTATVSRVLNSYVHVADTVRMRVLGAASSLGYTPNAAAKALVLQRSLTIGALVPTLENPSFSSTVEAPLTTMRVQIPEIGRLAAEFLLDRLEGRSSPERIEVPVSMIVRQSTAPPRGRA